MAKLERVESARFEFLISDLELALTLAQIAAGSGNNRAKKIRNQKNARRAYDTVREFANRIVITGTHRAEFNRKCAQLKSELEKLGELF